MLSFQEKQLLRQQLEEQGAELREMRQTVERKEREMNNLQEESILSEQLLRQQLEEYKEKAETYFARKSELESHLALKEAEL